MKGADSNWHMDGWPVLYHSYSLYFWKIGTKSRIVFLAPCYVGRLIYLSTIIIGITIYIAFLFFFFLLLLFLFYWLIEPVGVLKIRMFIMIIKWVENLGPRLKKRNGEKNCIINMPMKCVLWLSRTCFGTSCF